MVRRVVLTGGIATGKSYVLSRFSPLGAPVLDADDLARAVSAPDGAAWRQLRDRFGPEMFEADGQLDRRALGALVFADAGARADLNAIVHPHVRAAITAWFDRLDRQAASVPGIVAIPLYFESPRAERVDRVVVTACQEATQLARVMARGLREPEARQRIAAQLPTAQKVRRADHAIWTDGTHADTDRRVAEVWGLLSAGDSRQETGDRRQETGDEGG